MAARELQTPCPRKNSPIQGRPGPPGRLGPSEIALLAGRIPSQALRGAGKALAGSAAILLLFPAASARAESCDGEARLSVRVENLRSARGEVVLELYPDDQRRFLAHLGRVTRVRVKAQQPATEACLQAPGPGRYAVVIYHDENNDEVFNRSKIGLPTEGFGFSNNVRPLLGAPSLKSVLIDVPAGDTAIGVRLRYVSGGGDQRK